MRIPVLYMLIGPPYAGKSTWVKEQIRKINNHEYVIVDTDTWIENCAMNSGQNYNEVFKAEIRNAKRFMYQQLQVAISENSDIYWDQTNMTKNSRKDKLKNIPIHYDKIAIVFKLPNDAELARRMTLRKNKIIPQYVLDNMMNSYQEPTYDEGFTRIINA